MLDAIPDVETTLESVLKGDCDRTREGRTGLARRVCTVRSRRNPRPRRRGCAPGPFWAVVRGPGRAALIAVLLLFPSVQATGLESGGYAGAFLRLGVGAYPAAMGGALVASPNTVYALHYNPASLVTLSGPQLGASYALLSLDRKLGFVGFATAVGTEPRAGEIPGEPRRPRAGIGVGWVYAGVDQIDGRDLDGRPTGMLSNSENAFLFAFAVQPHARVALGLTGRVLYNRFPGVMQDGGALTSRGFGVDLGVLLLPAEGFSVGAVLRNLNAHYTWNTQGVWEHGSTKTDRFPRGWAVGLGYRHPVKRLLLLFQLEDDEHSDPRWAVGGEWGITPALRLRAGVRRNRPGVGLGLRQKLLGREFDLNYGFYAGPNAPRVDHWLGWQLLF